VTIARLTRVFASSALQYSEKRIAVRGWVFRLRSLASTTFIVVRDCTGEIQCVIATARFKEKQLKLDDAVELTGRIRIEPRAKHGCEMDIDDLRVLNSASHKLPFNSSSKLDAVGSEARIEYRPLTCRNNEVGDIFRIQAAALKYFRAYLESQHFQEIITSKIVASATEGGSNLFAIKYFERTAYLAQSPQFYKEHGVALVARPNSSTHGRVKIPHHCDGV
jgi:nondiscriminating aspartyl-tRNA synthetase